MFTNQFSVVQAEPDLNMTKSKDNQNPLRLFLISKYDPKLRKMTFNSTDKRSHHLEFSNEELPAKIDGFS